jgi:hypothetical protein
MHTSSHCMSIVISTVDQVVPNIFEPGVKMSIDVSGELNGVEELYTSMDNSVRLSNSKVVVNRTSDKIKSVMNAANAKIGTF